MAATRWAFALLLGLTPPGPARPADPPRLDAHGDPLPDGALRRLGTLCYRHLGPPGSAALSPDGRKIAVADGVAVRLLDAASGRELLRVRVADADVSRLAFSGDGRLLAAAADGVTVLRADTGAPVLALRIDRNRNSSLSLSADGRRLAVSREGRNGPPLASVWDVASGGLVGRFPQDGEGGVRLSPDGRWLATWGTSFSDPVRLWRVATGSERPLHGNPVRAVVVVAFSPDGRRRRALRRRRRLGGRHGPPPGPVRRPRPGDRYGVLGRRPPDRRRGAHRGGPAVRRRHGPTRIGRPRPARLRCPGHGRRRFPRP